MPGFATLGNMLAAAAMTVGALCCGAAASAGEQGTLSIIEIDSETPILPDRSRAAVFFLRNRLDSMGDTDAWAGLSDDERIAIWMPGDRAPDLDDLTSTATVGFHPVDTAASESDLAQGIAREGYTAASDADGRYFAISETPMIGPDGIANAKAVSGYDSRPVISFRFTSAAAKLFGGWTRDHIGDAFAIVVEGEVVSAPVIREPILGGSGQISGNFTLEQAQALAVRMVPPPEGMRFRVIETCRSEQPRAPPAIFPNWKTGAACP